MRQLFSHTANEEGSVIVIAIMVLALLTIVGVMSTGTSVTESFIVRNVALHKQNVYLTEAAVMEGLQKVMQLTYPAQTNAQLSESRAGDGSGNDVSLWLNVDTIWNKDSAWYSQSSGRALDTTDANLNLTVPDFAVSTSTSANSILATRGELDKGYLQMALIGWEPAASTGGNGLKATGPVRRAGRILAEYMSPNHGMVRLEIGLERIF